MIKYFLVLLLFISTSCNHPKDQFLLDFGVFINETEANYNNYTDTEFKIVEINYIEFKEQEEELKDYFSDLEKKQIKDYHKRFKISKIKRDPLNNLLEILK
jgi:hypothetical protein